MIGIYKITNPKSSIYIGQSIDIERRFKTYKSLNSKVKLQPKLFNSFLKYGVENHKFEIILECNVNELNDKERYYQDIYNSISRTNGLNCILTKSNDKSGTYSEESKLKMSNSAKNKKLSDSHKLKISKSLIGNKRSLGIKQSEATRLKKSKNSLGNNYRGNIIIDIETGVFYSSQKEVCALYGLKASSLSSMLNNRYKNNTNFKYS